MTVLLDASVVLAVLLDEPGAPEPEGSLRQANISAVNYSEVIRRLVDGGMALEDATNEVDRLHIQVIPFDQVQAVDAAGLRPATRKIGASFADRACLGFALRSGLPVLTADRRWSELDLPIEIRQIR